VEGKEKPKDWTNLMRWVRRKNQSFYKHIREKKKYQGESDSINK
jgi:hypothetical protein